MMREVELFKRGAAQTLIPLFAKNQEVTLQTPVSVSEYEQLHLFGVLLRVVKISWLK